MKKIILLLALFATLFSFAQEIVVIGQKRPPMNISLNYNGLAGSYFGLSFEVGDFTDTGMSEILSINYGIMNVSKNGVSGNGYSIDAGGRQMNAIALTRRRALQVSLTAAGALLANIPLVGVRAASGGTQVPELHQVQRIRELCFYISRLRFSNPVHCHDRGTN